MRLKDKFDSPYDQYKERNGQPFTFIGEQIEEVDEECRPMYRIRFEDGQEITAWPEEIESEAEVGE